MRCKDARLNPADVQYINAHATSTPLGDKAETVAMKRAFGDHAQQAGGELHQVDDRAPARRRRRGRGDLLDPRDPRQVAPPTINYDTPDPDCDLDYVPNTARKMKIDVALSNSFGFGGTNGTLIFRRFSG